METNQYIRMKTSVLTF